MKQYEPLVLEWIKEHFDVSEVEIHEAGFMPSGKMIKDVNGDTMLVFYDILTGQVQYKF